MITKFSFWQPEGQVRPKHILVLVPPSQSDGRYMVNSPKWQEFAKEHELGLVGCYFQDAVMGGWIETYCNMAYGAGDKLIAFVQEELKTGDIPTFLMWGFSAGGQFNHEFAAKYPERVGAYVVNKGGVYFTALTSEATRKLPALYIVGQHDAPWRKDMVRGIYGLNYVAGAANWFFVEEKDEGHSVGNSEALSLDLFKAFLSAEK